MKVIVASRRTQGARDNDFSWTLDGELVHLPGLECDCGGVDGPCGCRRSLCGVASRKATTTAEVAERELEASDVFVGVAEALVDGGWFDALDGEAFETGVELVGPLLMWASLLPVGTVIERRGGRISVREHASEHTS